MFFLHLKRREMRCARQRFDDVWIDDWSGGSGEGMSLPPASSPESPQGDEMIEQREPWERSVDWWKDSEESGS